MELECRPKVDKKEVAQNFGRAASRYNRASELQKRVANHLFSHLKEEECNQFQSILDAGCGTGQIAKRLKEHYPKSKIHALDLSSEMLAVAKRDHCADYYHCGDIENMPFKDESFSLITSNLALQWCHNLEGALEEFRRILLPKGIAIFTTVIDGSLFELAEAWSKLDDRQHILDFLNFKEVERAAEGLNIELYQYEEILKFPSILSLLRSLQNVGATTLPERRAEGLRGRSLLTDLSNAYPKSGDLYPLTYKIVLGVMKK